MGKVKYVFLTILSVFFITACSCSKITYTVTYDTDGGTKVSKEIVEKGEKATVPVDPTKDGYTFIGWYLEEEKYDFNSEVTKDITLKAKWEKKGDTTGDDSKEDNDKNDTKVTYTYYKVTFDSNGGSSIPNRFVIKGMSTNKPVDPTREGYTFVGWVYNDEIFDFSSKIYKNITLKAIWEKVVTEKTYTVKFDTDGGSAIKDIIVKENTKIKSPGNPVKEHYEFLGWFVDDIEFDFNNVITSDITLKAKWEYVPTISYIKEDIKTSVVDQVVIYVTKDDVKVDGYVTITTITGKTKTVSVPSSGYITNGKIIKEITKEKIK